MKNALFLGLLAILSLSSCKDKTVEEYQRDKARQENQRISAVEGDYQGIVTSKLDGRVLGAMNLHLNADTQSDPSNGGRLGGPNPILVGAIRFLDRTEINISSGSGYYDPDMGTLHFDFKISRSGGGSSGDNGSGNGNSGTSKEEMVTLSATVNGGNIAGDIAARNYPEYGGSFQLTKGAQSLVDLLRAARPENPGDNQGTLVTSFSGNTQFRLASRPVRILILDPIRNSPEDFLNVIEPMKSVQVSLNYSNKLHLNYPSVIWDTRQGYLTGQVTFKVGQSGGEELRTLTLDCRMRAGRMNCSHITSSDGVTAQSTLTLDNGDAKDPPDTTDQTITRKDLGRGKVGDSMQKIGFTVTYLARSGFQELAELFFPETEKFVNASVNFEFTSVTFINAKWDQKTGLLDGTYAGNGYVAQIQCHNYYFTATNKPFTCRYWTSRSPEIEIQFPGR